MVIAIRCRSCLRVRLRLVGTLYRHHHCTIWGNINSIVSIIPIRWRSLQHWMSCRRLNVVSSCHPQLNLLDIKLPLISSCTSPIYGIHYTLARWVIYGGSNSKERTLTSLYRLRFSHLNAPSSSICSCCSKPCRESLLPDCFTLVSRTWLLLVDDCYW